VGRACRMLGKMRNNAKFSSEELKESDYLRDLGEDMKLILMNFYYEDIELGGLLWIRVVWTRV
jgi:hypothetical protein